MHRYGGGFSSGALIGDLGSLEPSSDVAFGVTRVHEDNINKKKVEHAELSKRIFVLCRSTIFDTVVCIAVDCRMLGMLSSQERV